MKSKDTPLGKNTYCKPIWEKQELFERYSLQACPQTGSGTKCKIKDICQNPRS